MITLVLSIFDGSSSFAADKKDNFNIYKIKFLSPNIE